jgi:NB-ARC domain
VSERLPLLQRPWAYLHRNLSGKYRVVPLGGDVSSFDQLKTTSGARAPQFRGLKDGVYIDYQEPVRVELIETNVNVADFFFPNGAFKGKTFELLSLISDNRIEGDASPYMAPAGERPASETEGKGTLDPIGNTWTNLPIVSSGYVERTALQGELYDALKNDRHPVITLVGRGGIGKTSLAITVLNRAARESLFEAIIWFSARDIDLLPEGPKIVAPRVLSQNDIAGEFVGLLEPNESKQKGFRAIDYFASSLTRSPTGKPLLFVFDNFETVRNPADLFGWLDMHIRLPNKILITSRYREFKADFPIEVSGMTEPEADQLISAAAHRLGITELITRQFRTDLYEEADGHPYIIKVLLGEVSKAGKLVKVERIVAGNDDILDALFERTYAELHPVAKRIFLTLCSWRSLVPQLALEAVLLRPSNEKMDVGAAVEELVSSSFVDRTTASDGSVFLDVVLVASVFGRRKLEITPMRAAINADVDFLQQIGASSASALRHGVGPRIERLFQNIASRLGAGRVELVEVVPSLEFICRQYPKGWPLLAKLHEESDSVKGLANAAECLRRFLEHSQSIPDQTVAWDNLARIYQASGDWTGAAQARISRCKLLETPYSELSNTANWLNNLFRDNHVAIDSDEKRLLYQ